eukprot:3452950-Prymnesium_polylepis.1
MWMVILENSLSAAGDPDAVPSAQAPGAFLVGRSGVPLFDMPPPAPSALLLALCPRGSVERSRAFVKCESVRGFRVSSTEAWNAGFS